MTCDNSNCSCKIKCEAQNCQYHSSDDACTAGKIEVGSSSATDSYETQCKTFKCNK